VTSKTRLLIINFPHNPTGALLSGEQYTSILEFARAHDLWVFSDEMYRFLEYDPDQRLPAGCDIYGNCLSLCGMSKSLALPGLRIGWLAARDQQLMKQLNAFKDYTTICSSAPSEILAIMGLKNREKIISRNLDIIRRNLLVLENFMEVHSGLFRWVRPRGGSVTFPLWTGDRPVDEMCLDLAEKKGIMLLPSTVYGYEVPAVRFGLGRQALPEGLEKLDDYLKRNM